MATNLCLNCETSLQDDAAYCSLCGAAIVTSPLSVRHLLKDSFSTLIDWEEGTFRTFRDLLTDPSRVVRFYWEGGRKRYVEPLRFFFMAFIIYQLYLMLLDDRAFFIAFIEGFHKGAVDAILTSGEQERLMLLVEISTVLFFLILPIMSIASNAAFSKVNNSYADHIVLNSYLVGHLLLLSIVFDGLTYVPMMDIAGMVIGLIVMAVYVVITVMRSMSIGLKTAIGGILLATLMGFTLLAILFGIISSLVL